MYLAGLMADETKITKAQLNEWIEAAYWSFLSEFAVPWVAAETPFGFELGLEWITSKKETTASGGWQTLSCFAAINSDEKLDLKKYSELLDLVAKDIHTAQNRVKQCMNTFVIAIGSTIKELTPKALEIASKIGVVTVDMNGSSQYDTWWSPVVIVQQKLNKK